MIIMMRLATGQEIFNLNLWKTVGSIKSDWQENIYQRDMVEKKLSLHTQKNVYIW